MKEITVRLKEMGLEPVGPAPDFRYYGRATAGGRTRRVRRRVAKRVKGGKQMKWMCTVCLFIKEGEEPPEECPICGSPKSEYKQVP